MSKPSLKRVVFVPFITALGGSERLILDLSRFLHDAGIPHTLACFSQSVDLQSYSDRPLDIHELRPKRNPFLEAKALKEFLKSTTGGASRPLLFDLKSAFYSGVTSARPFVLHLTDPPSLLPADISKHAPSARKRLSGSGRITGVSALSAELVHRLNRRGARRASTVIVMTEKIKAELRSLYDVDAVVIRPGVSASCVNTSSSNAGPTSFRMLSVCRLEGTKRIDWILRALANISTSATKEANWQLEIVGVGAESEALKKLAVELGLRDRAIFLGRLSDEELADAYARANLFLMPAAQGYGLPALEALSRRIPTIVHRDSGVSEILAGNPWVEIVDGNNGSLSKAITVMIERIERNELPTSCLPAVPTSSHWAKAICVECGWLPIST